MREDDMTAYELMLSESQERMLCVAELGREDEVLGVFRKWGLKAEVVGHVTDDGIVTVTRHGIVEAQVDPKLLTDHCPVYKSTITEPEYFRTAASFDPAGLPAADPQAVLPKLLASPDVASKRWVFEQYDQQVQTQTTLAFGEGDAAVLAPRGTDKGVVVKIDGNARQTYMHPYRGGLLAVVEAARNVACTGARPQAVTDGLNFGNPTLPHVYWQFERAVKGIADAAEALKTPVISGNVSFYNESDLGEVPPTPLIGMLGLLERAEDRVPSAPKKPTGLFLVQIPELAIEQGGLGASLWLAEVHGQENGYPESPDLAGEVRLQNFLATAVETKVISSAHDTSEGGLAVALAEIALKGGVEVSLAANRSVDSVLFGEIPGQVIVGSDDPVALGNLAREQGLLVASLGNFQTESGLRVEIAGTKYSWSDSELRGAYEGAIPAVMAESQTR